MRKPFQTYKIACIVCGEMFNAKKSHAKSCSNTCRSILYRGKLTNHLNLISPNEDIRANNRASWKSSIPIEKRISDELPAEKSSASEYLEYNIYTTPYGVLFSFFGFEECLHSVLPDSCILRDFKSHLEKGKLFYNASQEDGEKIDCLKLLLSNRDFIMHNIRLSAEGVNRYKGRYFIETKSIKIPEFLYSY
jgi:hypothetical protein